MSDRDFPCECCDSDEEHERALELAWRDFLLDPGSPPAHWDEDRARRVIRMVNAARRDMLAARPKPEAK